MPQQRRRYKTIENFLRRMAFNLGNTISQTDVKVLSCIPLDVTDLQKRITELEKELSDEKNKDHDDDKGRRSSKDENGKNGKRRNTKTGKDIKRESKDSKRDSKGSVDGKEKKRDSKASVEDKEKEEEKTAEDIAEVPEGEKENEEEKPPEETNVMLMQTNRRKAKQKLRTNSMAGKNYLRDYLNTDSTGIEVNSLYKVAEHKGRRTNEPSRYNNAESSSDDNVENDNINAHRSAYKVKKQKHNPFTVIMGNVKKRKHIDAKKFEHTSQNTAYNQACDSGSSYSVIVPVRKKENKNCPDCKVEGEVDHGIGRHKKKFNRVKEKMQTFIPRNQYVYYAQTNSQFNPDCKKDKNNCDLSYIANLLEKQYAPGGPLKENKGLPRQFSLPVCNDRDNQTDVLPSKYAPSYFDPWSCCPGDIKNYGVNDTGRIVNVALPPSQNYYHTHSNNNGRFNDCTMYDMVPVKQMATKKHTELLTFEGIHQKSSKNKSPSRKPKTEINPPFNLHPSHSYEILQNCNDNLKHLPNDGTGLRRHHDKHYDNKKKVQSSRHCRMKTTNKHNITIDPEDIYMTNILHSDSDIQFKDEHKESPNNEGKTKSNEITEIKSILQNFVKELKQDIPKLQGTINNQDSLNLKHDGVNDIQQTVTSIKNLLANQCAFIPGYPSVLPTTQCCCPILCPMNFNPEAYKAHPIDLSSVLHKKASECCINNNILKTDQNSNSENLVNLPETKKLIDAIYKSVSLQSEHKNNQNTKADSENEKDKVELGEQSIKATETANFTLKYHTCSKTPCPHCGGNRKSSGDTTETESKELIQNLTDRSASSMHTESCVMSAENVHGHSSNNIQVNKRINKKSKFSNFLDALKAFASKKTGETAVSSEVEIKNFAYEGKPSFRQNSTQYAVTCKRDHSRQNAQRRMHANRNINTEIHPGDVYKSSYFDSEEPLRDRNPRTDHLATSQKCCSPKSFHRQPRGNVEEPRICRDPREIASNCYYMSEPNQIPFCLKEIEVKNMGTQIEKRKKFFAIFKKLKASVDSDGDYSNDHIQSYDQNRPRFGGKRATSHTQTDVTQKKKGFLQFLKGETEIDYRNINSYNLLDHGVGNVGMRPNAGSMLSPNQNSSFSKKGGRWSKYMQSFEKAKQRELSERKLKWFKRNPFSFRNLVMRTIIGQKPVANMKPAKQFF